MNKTQLILIVLLTVNIIIIISMALFYPVAVNAQSNNRIKECYWYDNDTLINDVIKEKGPLAHLELQIVPGGYNGAAGITDGSFVACW